jgi:cytochrome c-type biogenesis protein CcmH/NrfG
MRRDIVEQTIKDYENMQKTNMIPERSELIKIEKANLKRLNEIPLMDNLEKMTNDELESYLQEIRTKLKKAEQNTEKLARLSEIILKKGKFSEELKEAIKKAQKTKEENNTQEVEQ